MAVTASLTIDSAAGEAVPLERRGLGLLEPDVLGAEQFFATFRREHAALDRERLLMLAVLEDAIACYQRSAGAREPRGRQLFEETKAWVSSTERSGLFTFESICDVLDIDSDYLRRGLRQWHERRPAVEPLARDATGSAGRRGVAGHRVGSHVRRSHRAGEPGARPRSGRGARVAERGR